MEPTTVSGPTQNSRLAVKNASLTVECGRPRELQAWRRSPITSVVSPSPASTRCCRRTGSRAPTSQPTSVPASTVATLMSVPVTRGPQSGTGRDNAARMPRADILLVSLGSTAGLRAADAELHASMARGGARVVQVTARAQPDVRTLILTDLVWARAAGAPT